MYRLSQGKHSISALELKRCLGVRYPTAYYLKQKILCATDAAEAGRTLQNRVENFLEQINACIDRHGPSRMTSGGRMIE